jgi:hypothetical protein
LLIFRPFPTKFRPFLTNFHLFLPHFYLYFGFFYYVDPAQAAGLPRECREKGQRHGRHCQEFARQRRGQRRGLERKYAKNSAKLGENCRKLHKNARKMTENGRKMGENGQKLKKIGQKAVKNQRKNGSLVKKKWSKSRN